MKPIWVVSLLLQTSTPLFAGFSSSDRGASAAQFLQLGAGARAAALGEAYSAAVDDASALYWNPAAMTRVESRSATFMHSAYIAPSYFDYGAYAQKWGEGALGASVQYFSAGSLTQTDATGADAGSFRPYDLAATAGYARTFGGYSLGLGVKYIQSKIIASARTAAVDIGLLSPGFGDDRLRFALTASNLGGTMKFDQARENLPFAMRLGSAYKVTNRWLAALDVAFPRSDRPFGALGSEYQLIADGSWKFAGRAGFNSRTLGSVDGFAGISAGIGLGYNGYALDYGFVPFGGIGQAHRISLTLNF